MTRQLSMMMNVCHFEYHVSSAMSAVLVPDGKLYSKLMTGTKRLEQRQIANFFQ
jgi:hypothetical protein